MNDMIDEIYGLLETHIVFITLGLVVFCLILMLFLIITAVKCRKLTSRMNYFLLGARGESLEETLKMCLDDNQDMRTSLQAHLDEIDRMNENLLTSFRKVGIVKYNAFPGMAGKVSSSIALLNNENNGLIINCMHGPEGCYTYVKEIMNAKSINPLTKEDEEALKIALQMQV